MVLARPVPISRLAVRWSDVITSVPLQPHCAVVVGLQVDVPVPSVIAASRYVHVVLQSEPVEVNDVGELDIVGAT